LVDLSPPACAPDKTVECGSEWDFDEPSDNCGMVTLNLVGTVTNTAGFCGQTFEATRSWEATDECGNMSECSQTVTVVDSTPPTLACVADKTVECGSEWDFDEAMAVEICGIATISVLSTVTNTADFCGGTLQVIRIWQATDECGNVSEMCGQSVTVADTVPPMLSCPADRTVACGDPWMFDEPTATDACGVVQTDTLGTVTNSLPSGGYTATRSWQAADECGNLSECSQTILVEDAVPTLSIALDQETGLARLCWPAVCSDFVLEFTTRLDEPSTWLEVEEPAMTVGLENCVNTPASGGTRYFRLRRGP
jgi:hypothetical protein